MSVIDNKSSKKTNMILLIILFLVVAILVFTVFVKDKVFIENENGEDFVGASGKFLKLPESQNP